VLLAKGVDRRARQFHVAPHRAYKVVAILEAARLEAVAEERYVLVAEGLHDEVGDYAPVLRVHVGPVGIEYAHHPRIDAVFAAIVGGKCLGAALALVVAAADADGVDVAPVALDLRMHERIAIDFARGGVENLRLRLERKVEHVHHAQDARLHRLHGVVLVVDGARRAGKVVYFVELAPIWLGDVVQDEREAPVVHQPLDVALRAGEQVVEGGHLVSLVEQPLAEVAAQKARGTRYKRLLRKFQFHFVIFSLYLIILPNPTLLGQLWRMRRHIRLLRAGGSSRRTRRLRLRVGKLPARSRALRTSLRLSRLDKQPSSACHASASTTGCVQNLSYGAESSATSLASLPSPSPPRTKRRAQSGGILCQKCRRRTTLQKVNEEAPRGVECRAERHTEER